MPRDLPEDVDRDTGVGHPCQPGVTKIMTPQVLVTERGHDLVPVRRIPQHGGADPAAPGAGEQPGVRVAVDGVDPFEDELASLDDDRNLPGPLMAAC